MLMLWTPEAASNVSLSQNALHHNDTNWPLTTQVVTDPRQSSTRAILSPLSVLFPIFLTEVSCRPQSNTLAHSNWIMKIIISPSLLCIFLFINLIPADENKCEFDGSLQDSEVTRQQEKLYFWFFGISSKGINKELKFVFLILDFFIQFHLQANN